VITYEIPRLSLSWPHCCRYYWRQCWLKKHNNIFLGKITMKNCPDWKNMQKLLNWQSHSLSHSVVYTDSLKQNSLYYSSMVECPPLQFSKFDQMWLSTDEVIKVILLLVKVNQRNRTDLQHCEPGKTFTWHSDLNYISPHWTTLASGCNVIYWYDLQSLSRSRKVIAAKTVACCSKICPASLASQRKRLQCLEQISLIMHIVN
jgi:hypothetical protein